MKRMVLASVHFAEDGTFVAEGVPSEYLYSIMRSTGFGIWRVEKRIPQDDFEWLYLKFEDVEEGPLLSDYLQFSGQHEDAIFEIMIGGPDNPKQVCHFSRQ